VSCSLRQPSNGEYLYVIGVRIGYVSNIGMPNGSFERRGGGQGDAMDGTRAGVGVDPIVRSGEANIWNSEFAGSPRCEDLRSIRIYGNKRGSCELTGHFFWGLASKAKGHLHIHASAL